MKKDLFDDDVVGKGCLDNDDVKFLLKKGYRPHRLLLFYDVSDNALVHLLALIEADKIKAN